MARTKRKANLPADEIQQAAEKPPKKYKAAGYARLSVEDSGRPGAETIETQKALIAEFIEKTSDMEFVSLFCDNGMTGTDFQRPGFEKLMEAVRSGRVNCIVVKDLSRFGRNYKEAGNYLERIFPFLGVRFIAITDGLDTLTAERGPNGFIIPLKNLINETYSRDISRKSASALHTKQKRGEFIGSWAPYGYNKDPEDPHRLIPNPETAPIVRRIFDLRLRGISHVIIARTLNAEGIASPSRYLIETGQCKNECFAKSVWSTQSVKSIVSKQVYIGHMVQGVKRQSFCNGEKPGVRPESEWIIVRNTHEPIVDEDVFFAVRKIDIAAKEAYHRRLGKNDRFGKTENVFKGFIFCADCGRPLVRYKKIINTKLPKPPYYTFICPSHSSDPSSCPLKSIRETELITVLREAISKQIELAGDMKELASTISCSPSSRKKANSLEGQLSQARRSLHRCESLRESLYQNYAECLMTETEYLTMKKRYAADEELYAARIREIEERISAEKKLGPENSFITAFGMVSPITVITEEILTALVDRIEIGANHRIEIKFRFRDEFRELDQHLKKEAAPDEYRSKVSSHFE